MLCMIASASYLVDIQRAVIHSTCCVAVVPAVVTHCNRTYVNEIDHCIDYGHAATQHGHNQPASLWGGETKTDS